MRKSALYSLLFTIFNDALGWGIVLTIFAPLVFDYQSPIIPEQTSDGERNVLLGFLIASYALTQFFSMPIIGALSDHYGRKKLLEWTLLLAGVSCIISAVAISVHSLVLLFVSRLLAGLFSGNAGTAQASIADISSDQNKGKNLALSGIAGSVSWMIGPPLGGILSTSRWVSWFNFSTPFWVMAALFFANAIWVIKAFDETYAKSKLKHDWKQEIKDLVKLWRLPRMNGWLIVAGLFYLGYFFFLMFFPTFLVHMFSFTQENIGFLSAYWAFWWLIGSFILNKSHADKVGASSYIVLSVPILAVCIFANALFQNPIYWLSTLFIMGFAGTAAWTYVMTICSNLAGRTNQGKLFGVLQALTSFASFVSPIAAGFLAIYSIPLPVFVSAFILVLCGLFAANLRRKERRA